MDYEEYQNQCSEITKINEQLLEVFKESLCAYGLKEKTIRRHLSNVDFYINTFLLRCDALSMEQGIFSIDEYLGDFFIRKCMWSTPGSIKTSAASIKKFYKCMLECKKISADDYSYLCKVIRENMDEWQYRCAIYNDPDMPSPFFMF